ncbi:hypothetical protein CKA34_28440 (plasmid) [Rhizobium sp. 11515TR]|nr:hypothetical protein CKA34_28440 [Rhizobium sp. 11515TR]
MIASTETGTTQPHLAAVKNALWNRGVKLADGHAFLGAEFDASYLAGLPQAGNVTTLKFLTSEHDIAEVAKLHRGVPIDVFDFYTAKPIAYLARKAICK